MKHLDISELYLIQFWNRKYFWLKTHMQPLPLSQVVLPLKNLLILDEFGCGSRRDRLAELGLLHQVQEKQTLRVF